MSESESAAPDPSSDVVEPSSRADAVAPSFQWRFWGWIALEMSVVALCLVVVFFKRLLELEQVEIGGDALKVWEFARTLALGGDFPERLNHHTLRFGLVLPSVLAQWLFGSEATSYFVGPLAASVLLHLWIYLICRKLSGPLGGALGVIALLGFEPMVRSSSQILPETFGPMYGAFATYAALLYTDAKTLGGRWAALGAVGLGLIFAYGSKMVYLFYAPGIALLVWFGGAKGPLLSSAWMDALEPGPDSPGWLRWLHGVKSSKLLVPACLTLVVLFLILVETLILVFVADSRSHFQVMQSSHGGGGAHGPRINGAGDFFALYTKAPFEWTQGLTAAAFAWLGVTAFARDRRSKLVGLTLLVFFVLQTFIVRRLDPLTPWFEPHPRYLLGMVGPIFMMIGLFAGDALHRIAHLAEPLRGKSLILSLLTALALFWAAGHELPERFDAEWGKRDAVSRTRELANDLSAAYRAGIPIVADTPEGKPAIAAASLLIDPGLLLDAEGRPIPSSRILAKTSKKGRFTARALLSEDIRSGRLRNVVEERARHRRCAVVLRQSVRFIVGNVRFDAKCESLEQEFANDPSAGKGDGSRGGRGDGDRRSRRKSPRARDRD